MQAADFAAWEFRKHHEKVTELIDLVQNILDPDWAWALQEQWILDKYGSHEGATRKSAIALIDGAELYPLVWDYRRLNEVHEIKGGVWG